MDEKTTVLDNHTIMIEVSIPQRTVLTIEEIDAQISSMEKNIIKLTSLKNEIIAKTA